MKSFPRLSLLAGMLVLWGQFAAVASTEDDILRVIQTLTAQKAGTVCRKGDAFRRIYSLRSFDGTLCSVNYVAAFALLTCKGVGDFDGSQCDKTALRTLNGAVPNVVLRTAITKKQANARALLCSNPQKLSPGAAKAAKTLCAIR